MAETPSNGDRPGLAAARLEREIRDAIAQYLWYLKENEACGGILTREHELALARFALIRISDAIGLATRRGFPINDTFRQKMVGQYGQETVTNHAARFDLLLRGEPATDDAMVFARRRVEELRAAQGVAYIAAPGHCATADDDDPHGSQASDGGC